MNIQTERLENHTARFTVEVDNDRLNKAMQAAARNIAKRVNIPGFRKGKAPYKVLVNYIGEAAILDDAVELLGNEVYKELLDQSDIKPYGPGQLEDFKIAPTPVFIFTVPMQPTVDLKAYRDVRLPYESSVVDDEMVNRAMRMVQEREAVVEETQKPAALGNRITMDIHSFVLDEKEEEEKSEESEGEAPAETTEPEKDLHNHDEDNVFLHEHDATVNLSEEDEPILPGFNAAMLGAVVGETREFHLTIPEDSEDYADLAGRKVEFHVHVKKIENVTLPALTDELAARITEKEEKPLTLLELRMRMRENLEKETEHRAKSNYSGQVLQKIIEQSSVSYPEEMIAEQSEIYIQDLDKRLRQQGIALEDFLKMTGRSRDELYAEYREPASQSVERQLVLIELARAENISVSDEDVSGRINETLSQFGEGGEGLRSVFDTPEMRNNIINDLMLQKVYARISDIGMGKVTDVQESLEENQTEENHTEENEANEERG